MFKQKYLQKEGKEKEKEIIELNAPSLAWLYSGYKRGLEEQKFPWWERKFFVADFSYKLIIID